MISDISATARWIAAHRADETERPDAIFRDPFARRLAGEEGARILRELPGARRNAWALVVRTAVLDEIILRAVREMEVDTVLNLACGLDTRPYRLPLPPDTSWVEVDLPGILDYKEACLGDARPVCRFERVRLDLADEARRAELFARVGAQGKRVLVLTEGLLCYLTEEQVAGLGRALRKQDSFRFWLTDLFSAELLRLISLSPMGRALKRAGAPMKFGPREGSAFFARLGWKLAEAHSSLEDGIRLRREPPLFWLARPLLRLAPRERRRAVQHMQQMVLFTASVPAG